MGQDHLRISDGVKIRIGQDFMSDGRHQRVVTIYTENDKKSGFIEVIDPHLQITVVGKNKIKVEK